MNGKLLSTMMIFLMVASSLSILAGGASVTFDGLEEGQVLNTKVVEVAGTAVPTPDEWVQDTPAHFDQGSYDNMTLAEDGSIVVAPYISGFVKDANNPIVDLGGNHTFNEYNMRLGAVIKDGDTYRMWATGMNRSWGMSLGYGTSTDGTDFDFQNASLDLGGPGAFDELAILPGTVIKDGATYKMWYTGMGADGIFKIGYATSQNGIDWTKGAGGDKVLDIGAINKFDGGGVATPAVIKDGATYKMWYAGLIAYSGDLWQIGYATSQNGVNWTKQNEGDPVLSFGKSTAFDKDGLWGPTVIKDGDVYRLWYIGNPNPAVGYAVSFDGVQWDRQLEGAPVMTIGGTGEFDENGIASIVIIRDGNDYKEYYTGMNSWGEERIGLAEASLEGLEGVFTSIFYDAGLNVEWSTVDVISDTPGGTAIEVKTRVSNDRVDWSTWEPLVNGSSAYENGRYLQYRITMTSPDGIALPSVSEVRIVYEAIERVEASTDNSTWFLAAGTKDWNISLNLVEGENTIYVRVMDTTQIPTYYLLNLVVDTIKPTGIVQIDGDARYTTDTAVDLSLAAVDASGVTHMRLGTSDNLTDVEWMDFTTSLGYDLPDVDGTVAVYVQLRDSTGLVSNLISDSITLDTTAPNGTVSIRGGAPMTTFQKVPLTLSATDTNGIAKMRIANDPEFTGSEWKTYAVTSEWTLEEVDGTKTVYVEYMDSAGMTTMVNDTIVLDTVIPTGSIVINDGDGITTERQVTLALTGNDVNGVSHVMVSNDPDLVNAVWMSFEGTMDWTLPTEIGEQTVYAKFKDSAGLVSHMVSDDIILDIHEEGFEGAIVVNDGDEYTNNQTLTLTLDLIGDDGESSVMLSEDMGFAGATWLPLSDTLTYTTTVTDDTVTVYAKFKDRFGVETAVVSDDIVVDMTGPSITILTPEEGAKVHKALVTFTGEASDNIDLLMVEVQLPNGQWIPVEDPTNFTYEVNLLDKGEHTLTVRATDAAGNMATEEVTIKYTEKKTEDTVPGFEATALVVGLLLVVLVYTRRRAPRV